jgi:hypothetical protein
VKPEYALDYSQAKPNRYVRDSLDFFETPPHYLKALGRHLYLISGSVLEPCVGRGAISQWVCRPGVTVITNDINPKHPADLHKDARSSSLWKKVYPRWTITNPPFDSIERILTLALAHSTNTISLARLSILEPTITRRKFFLKHGKPSLLIVLPRYQFTKPSKDTMTCCWVGWGPDVPELWTIDTRSHP